MASKLFWLEAVLPLGIIAGMLCIAGNAQYYIYRAANGRPKHIGNDMWDTAMERRDKKIMEMLATKQVQGVLFLLSCPCLQLASNPGGFDCIDSGKGWTPFKQLVGLILSVDVGGVAALVPVEVGDRRLLPADVDLYRLWLKDGVLMNDNSVLLSVESAGGERRDQCGSSFFAWERIEGRHQARPWEEGWLVINGETNGPCRVLIGAPAMKNHVVSY